MMGGPTASRGANVRVFPCCELEATTMVAPGGMDTGILVWLSSIVWLSFFCFAGGGTSWFSTLALLADFSTTALQIS